MSLLNVLIKICDQLTSTINYEYKSLDEKAVNIGKVRCLFSEYSNCKYLKLNQIFTISTDVTYLSLSKSVLNHIMHDERKQLMIAYIRSNYNRESSTVHVADCFKNTIQTKHYPEQVHAIDIKDDCEYFQLSTVIDIPSLENIKMCKDVLDYIYDNYPEITCLRFVDSIEHSEYL